MDYNIISVIADCLDSVLIKLNQNIVLEELVVDQNFILNRAERLNQMG